MRFRVCLVPFPLGGRPVLPYNYQYAVSSMIYDKLITTDPQYKELHDSTGFKFFTFSRLEVPRRRPRKDGLVILSNDVYLWFSSVDGNLARRLANALLKSGHVTIAGLDFAVVKVTVPREFRPREEGETLFTTMSPIVLKTVIEGDGRFQQWDLSPVEDRDEFCRALVRNLERKYTEYYGRPPRGSVEVTAIRRAHHKRIEVNGTYHRAHMMDIALRGDPDLIRFGYDCGLGQKNSMGFGMVGCRRAGL